MKSRIFTFSVPGSFSTAFESLSFEDVELMVHSLEATARRYFPVLSCDESFVFYYYPDSSQFVMYCSEDSYDNLVYAYESPSLFETFINSLIVLRISRVFLL